MSEAGHDLHSVFPDAAEALHGLKTGNAHFRSLAEQYHDLTREIVRIEEGVDAAGDARLEDMKKRRLGLLDEIAELIAVERRASA
ncbi:MAG: DUF465 domain-containing protein [Sphingobium sp.]|nr:DUF465 domain-containing protein [Sphingomonadaceae bacterium]MCH4151606.1 DUF465 domain-containing protein [Sphingobium sp.]MCI1271027.1 DUF465 domain-containing protein [Sphingobium sp.]MCI1755663.1 DUF465 domain-containing protein [Sphingobium sp.]MCI2052559.1 DUF465 domain-containing protein [Sphingobium sp.]